MSTPAKFYKIVQTRSVIGMPAKMRRTMQILGLNNKYDISYQRVSPATAHRLAQVKDLVRIELSDVFKTREQLAEERKLRPGFTIVKAPNNVI